MRTHVERDFEIWWHPGLAAWAWRCWKCRTPGAAWTGHARTWVQAYDQVARHARTDHHLTHAA